MKKTQSTTANYLAKHKHCALLELKKNRLNQKLEAKILHALDQYTNFVDIIESSNKDLIINPSSDHYEKVHEIYYAMVKGIRIALIHFAETLKDGIIRR